MPTGIVEESRRRSSGHESMPFMSKQRGLFWRRTIGGSAILKAPTMAVAAFLDQVEISAERSGRADGGSGRRPMTLRAPDERNSSTRSG